MARPRPRKKTSNPSSKVTRKANKRRKKVVIRGDPLVAAAWDRGLTLRQNYARLGLVATLNPVAGGVEPTQPPLLDPTEEGRRAERAGPEDGGDGADDLAAASESEDGGETWEPAGEGAKKKKGRRNIDPSEIPQGMGFIERDREGNVVNVVIGTGESVDPRDVEELPRVPAKTKLVQQLEERAANGAKKERYQSAEERVWIQRLIAKHGDDYEKMFRDRKLNLYQQTASQLKRRVEIYLESSRMVE